MAYKIASKLNQERIYRSISKWLPENFGSLTLEQQRDSLKVIWHQIEEELGVERDWWRRKALARKKMEVQDAMRAIRPKRRCPGSANFFIEAARQTLTPSLFNIVMTKSVELFQQSQIDSNNSHPKEEQHGTNIG